MDNPPEGSQDTKIDEGKKEEGVNESANETDNGSPLKSHGKASPSPLNSMWVQGIRHEKRRLWLEEKKLRYYTIQVFRVMLTIVIHPLIILMTLADATARRDATCPTEEDLLPWKAENLQTNRLYQSCIDFCRVTRTKPKEA
ncbi:hypothetical protein GE061_010576 [Apolygus lucorum]|uniref:Uncharacterized protein n=1 Tax=Apolygus lucorum TaxID=248454 RepID=A0A6A4JWJ1_APOLU|nr:hypothetical protein GE061_010576 [Apolygus lucorum]